jgi:CRISPR/Cas system CMR-associated protein Cmr3 (group 5 of RAMP superfamily)
MYAVSGVQKLGHLECITSHRQKKKKKENVRLYLINIISPNLIHIIARNSLITLSTTSEDRRQERERERECIQRHMANQDKKPKENFGR